MSVKQIVGALSLAFTISSLIVSPVLAQYSSPNYRIEETFFGTGGELDPSSPNYRAQQSAGSLAVGTASSPNYDASAGFITPNEPFLELFVPASVIDLGTLTESTTGTGTATFHVRTYLSGDYRVVTLSQPPTNESGAVLPAKSTLGAPSVGTAEFGMNLVDNSSPNIGANPVNIPDNSFADGEASAGYSTLNQFKYGVGDTVAHSPKTSGNQAVGRTDYTISYIANISSITAAGSYTMNHDLMVVATF
jgi:hypothetical protein